MLLSGYSYTFFSDYMWSFFILCQVATYSHLGTNRHFFPNHASVVIFVLCPDQIGQSRCGNFFICQFSHLLFRKAYFSKDMTGVSRKILAFVGKSRAVSKVFDDAGVGIEPF
ncbi:hypothetical protein U27_04476 [Candidatus Vecturithrix granuli]|uniref:Uncharacterized protein n=1 Tax=Vecturithrix granuli TaxID=1499967 RepID=A0A081BYV4_VECG1|nr:hypothetical protein U27_04476 [Candidatus Vecturithrix granuli]